MGNSKSQPKAVKLEFKQEEEKEKEKKKKNLIDRNQFHPESTLREMKEAVDLKYDFSLFVGQMRTPLDSTYEFYNVPLGSGSLGEVRKALHIPTRTIRAIQLISLSLINSSEQRNIDCDFHLREAAILKQLDHPNIIRMYEYYQDTRFFYIITTLCQGGDLYDQIVQKKSFGEDYAAYVFAQILKGIIFCHQRNIVHRDLKPENIMFFEREQYSLIQIVDFGFANILQRKDGQMNRKIGSLMYMAPEVIENAKGYTEQSDIWSLGMILYTMLSGYSAFLGDEDQIKQNIGKQEVEFLTEDWNFVSVEAKDLIKMMLDKDPEKRPSAQEVLKNIWMKQNFKERNVQKKLIKKLLSTAASFRPICELQTIICWNIMLMMVSYPSIKETYKVFDQLDKQKKSYLQHKDIVQSMKEAFKQKQQDPSEDAMAKARTNRLFTVFGKNLDNKLNFYEFMLLTIDKEILLSDRNVERFLKYIDVKKANQFTIEEMGFLFMGKRISNQIKVEIMKEVQEIVKNLKVDKWVKNQMTNVYEKVPKSFETYLVWRKYISYKLYKYVVTKEGLVILKEDYKSSDEEEQGEDDQAGDNEKDADDNQSNKSGDIGQDLDSESESKSQSEILSQTNKSSYLDEPGKTKKSKGNRDQIKKKGQRKLEERIKKPRYDVKQTVLDQVERIFMQDYQNKKDLLKSLKNDANAKKDKNKKNGQQKDNYSIQELDIRIQVLPLLEQILFRQRFDKSTVDKDEMDKEEKLNKQEDQNQADGDTEKQTLGQLDKDENENDNNNEDIEDDEEEPNEEPNKEEVNENQPILNGNETAGEAANNDLENPNGSNRTKKKRNTYSTEALIEKND